MQNCIVSVSQSQLVLSVVCAVLVGLQSVLVGFIKQSFIFIGAFIESMKLLALRKKEHLMCTLFNRCHSQQHRRVFFNWLNKNSWHSGLYNYCGKFTYYMTGNMGTNMSVIMSGMYIFRFLICYF